MEPPFAAVSSQDPVREAVELLVGRAAGAAGHRSTAAPTGIVTRTDLLEALAQ